MPCLSWLVRGTEFQWGTICNCFKKAGIGNAAQQSAIHDDDDPFSILTEDIESLRANIKELAPESINADDVTATDEDFVSVGQRPFTDEDILAEFTRDDMEQVDDEAQIGMVEDCPKKPATTEARQAIETLATYSLSVEEGSEEILRLTNELSKVTDRIKRKRQRQQNIKSFFKLASGAMDLNEAEMQD